MQKLTNKTAFVTGGSRGIGAAIVNMLAREGATVVFTYVNGKSSSEALVAELSAAGMNVSAIKADSAKDGEITLALEETISKHGRLDILINNAGIYIGKPFELHTLQDYDQTMAVNVRAVFEASLFAARKMENEGRIITLGSCMANRVPSVQGTLYAMSKSALTAFTKGLARDLGAKGITVNLVQPDPVNTDMNPENGAHADFQKSLMAIRKYGQPRHIADLVAYLVDPATEYTTGSIMTIDGGTSC